MQNKTQEEIMKDWNVSETDMPLVSIKCMTYNQEKYISQCIDGFLMQKTTFPFEILIHDDCSTDNTTNIILEYAKKYPKLIKPILEEENQYSKHDGSHHEKIDAEIKGKYIALCEGDDYWIDEKKLQRQIEFLEKERDYGLCYTKAKQFIQLSGKYSKRNFGQKIKTYEDLFVKGNKIPTPSVVFRKEILTIYKGVFSLQRKSWKMGDLPLWLYIYKNFKVKYFRQKTCVYRVLIESASHSLSLDKENVFRHGSYEIRKDFSDLFGNPDFFERFALQESFNYAWNKRDYKQIISLYKKIPIKDKSYQSFAKFLFAFISYFLHLNVFSFSSSIC